MVSGGRGVRPMSQTTARGIAYTRVLSEARKQLNMGTEVEALIDAAGDLRELDSNDPTDNSFGGPDQASSADRVMAIRAKLVECGKAPWCDCRPGARAPQGWPAARRAKSLPTFDTSAARPPRPSEIRTPSGASAASRLRRTAGRQVHGKLPLHG